MNAQSEEVKISCPHCGQHLVIDESMLGTELECPTCKQSFLIRESGSIATGMEENVERNFVEPAAVDNNELDAREFADSELVASTSVKTAANETIAKRSQISAIAGKFLTAATHISVLVVGFAGRFASAAKRLFVRVTAEARKVFVSLPQRSRRIAAFSAAVVAVVFMLWIVLFSGKTIKLPPVPDGVCIPFANAKGGSSCIYLGAYRVGRAEYNAFYWPEHEYDGKREKDTLFLQFVEFEVLPKLGWTSYVQMEGEEIDKFHDACVASVDACREANRKAKEIGKPVHWFDISAKFPNSFVRYYSSDGMWQDSNPAFPGASYMPGEVENGILMSGTVLLGFTVQRRTTRITGQQGWWTNPPYRMLFGIFLDPDGSDASPIQTFLDFSDRARLNKISRMNRKAIRRRRRKQNGP